MSEITPEARVYFLPNPEEPNPAAEAIDTFYGRLNGLSILHISDTNTGELPLSRLQVLHGDPERLTEVDGVVAELSHPSSQTIDVLARSVYDLKKPTLALLQHYRRDRNAEVESIIADKSHVRVVRYSSAAIGQIALDVFLEARLYYRPTSS